MEGGSPSAPGALARVRVMLSRSVLAEPAPSAPLAGTSRLHRRAAYTRCLRCAGAPRRPTSGSGLSLPFRPDMPSSLTPGSSTSHVSSVAMPTRPSPRSERLGTPNTPAIRFTRGSSFEASLVRVCYGLSGCSPPWTDRTKFPWPTGDFYIQASGGSVALPAAEYDYNSHWTPLLAGLSPAGMAASLAAPNPFAAGIPVEGGDPILLDFATSIIAQGKTRGAHNKGGRLLPGQMLDDKGQPTTDPKYGVVNPLGALLTFGQHKGFGLSLVCELLGGALAGGLAIQGPGGGERRIINGMLTILIAPAALADPATFQREVQACLEWIKASPPQPGIDGVQLAGEPERATRARRLAEGIPVDETTWTEILTAAAALGISP